MKHNRVCTRWRASAIAGAFCIGISLYAGLAGYAAAAEIAGRPHVTDGDTLRFGKDSVRIAGIDAPERAELCDEDTDRAKPCGQIAAEALRDKIGKQIVTCTGGTIDRYNRLVATCYAGGEDLGAFMVRSGQALAYRRYSMAYVAEEDEAREAGRGLWAGSFVAPWAWRRANQ